MSHLKIIWSKRAIQSLEGVFNFYKEKSLTAAQKIVNEILESPKTIHFPKQYQIDNVNPKYRRIIVRDYKILYSFDLDVLYVYNIICTKKDPKAI